jgi:molybdenum cofactor cytidylyltransferase
MTKNQLTGLIIAAGLSGRMNSFKPLLEINGKSFIQIITEKLLSFCNEVIIVTGFNSAKIIDELGGKNLSDKCRVVFNKDYEKGMFSSLKCGLNNSESSWYLYHFIDQPSLGNDFYLDFSKQISDKYNWIQPVNKGRKGHPILFDRFVSSMIASADDTVNLRDLSRNKDIKKYYWEYNSENIFEDIDKPEDYQRLKFV